MYSCVVEQGSLVSGAVLGRVVQFILGVLFDVFLFDVSIVVAFDAGASDQDEKEAKEAEAAHH